MSVDNIQNMIEEESVMPSEDISQNDEFRNYYDLSICKSWIKLLPISKTILFEDYNCDKNYYVIRLL